MLWGVRVLLLIFFSLIVECSVIYAAPNGTSDSFCGSLQFPCTVSQALAIASNGTTIILLDGFYVQPTVTISALYLTIQGSSSENVTFSSSVGSFQITKNSNVTISGITFFNYFHTPITCNLSNVTIDSVVFNVGSRDAITASGYGTPLIINNCVFQNLHPDSTSSNVITSSSPTTIQNSLFEQNYRGIQLSGSSANIFNTTFINNNYDLSRTASVCTLPSNTVISGSTFINNTNFEQVIQSSGTKFDISTSIFTNNQQTCINANHITAEHCTFSNNFDILISCISGQQATITSSIFIGNTVNGTGSGTPGTVVLTNGHVSGSTFQNNQVYSGRNQIVTGTLVGRQAGQAITITDCYFTENSVSSNFTSYGGAVAVLAGGNVVNSTFVNNTAFQSKGINGNCYGGSIYGQYTTTIDSCLFMESTTSCYGGAVAFSGHSLRISSSFFDNIQGYSGDSIYASATLSIVDSEFTNNNNPSRGPVVYFNGTNTPLLLESTWFYHFNTSTAPLIVSKANSTTINGSLFSSNSFTQGGSSGTPPAFGSSNSGVIYCSGKQLAVTDSSFQYNTVSSTFNSAGAVFSSAISTFTSTQFVNNTITLIGGSGYHGAGAAVNIQNSSSNFLKCNFTGNSVTDNSLSGNEIFGGAVFLNHSLCAMNEVVAIGNSLFSYHNVSGGFVFQNGANLTITSSQLLSNQAVTNSSSFGGALAGDVIIVQETIFQSNQATNGGGISSRNANINNATFSFNKATENGGDIFSQFVVVEISEFDSSSAMFGSAIYGAQVNASHCTFTNQNVMQYHGVIYAPSDEFGEVFVIDCLGIEDYGEKNPLLTLFF